MTAMIKPNELDNISLKIALEKSIYASAKCIKELDKPIMKNLYTIYLNGLVIVLINLENRNFIYAFSNSLRVIVLDKTGCL